MKTFQVIMSHRDEPQEFVLAEVEARSRGRAHDECIASVRNPESIFHGYDFTIWPDAV